MDEDSDKAEKMFRIKLPPKPETRARLQSATPPGQDAGQGSGYLGESLIPIDQAVEYIRARGLIDSAKSPVSEQLRAEAESMMTWAGVSLLLMGGTALAIDDLGSWEFVLIGLLILGKSVLFAREADKMRKVVRCFDQHDARTLDDLTQRLGRGA